MADLYDKAVRCLTPDEFRAFMLERIAGLRMMAHAVTCIEESDRVVVRERDTEWLAFVKVTKVEGGIRWVP